jgi:hypothetical protein
VRLAHAQAHDTFGFNHDPNDENTAWSLGTEHAFFFSFFYVSWTGVYFGGFSWTDETKGQGTLKHFGFG